MTPIHERVLAELQKEAGESLRSGTIAARLSCAGITIARRTVYNKLIELKHLGLVDTPSPRKWCAV